MEKSTKWLAKYEQFLLKNSQQIGSIESSLRSLSFILPGRFKDAEVASESLYSLLQILGIYHDKIIIKAAKKHDSGFKSGSHNRYTEFQIKHNRLFRIISILVQLTRFTELLWEMIARRKFGNKMRWRVVSIIEAFKAALRLVLLAKTQRPLTNPLIPEREVDPEKIDNNNNDNNEEGEENDKYRWKMPRTSLGLEKTPEMSNVDEFLSTKILTTEDVKSPIELLHTLDKKGISAEVLYILRPLVYALLSYKLPTKYKWSPWLVGIFIEYFARRILMGSYQQNIPGGFRGMTKLESQEIQKRGMNMWWWLLRGEFYNSISKPIVYNSLRKVSWIPGVGMIGGIVEDYLYLLDEYYFSASSL